MKTLVISDTVAECNLAMLNGPVSKWLVLIKSRAEGKHCKDSTATGSNDLE